MNYFVGIASGAFLTVFSAYLYQEVSYRLNNGKKVYSGRRAVGRVVCCRFNGSKHWFYVDEHCELSKEYYFSKREAIEACVKAHAASRPTYPKQSIFARVV